MRDLGAGRECSRVGEGCRWSRVARQRPLSCWSRQVVSIPLISRDECQAEFEKDATSELDHPYVGDTTSNQALIFSPPFNPEPILQPTYPNYTLPAANLTFPSEPSTPPNYSLVFATTESSTIKTLPRTTCAIRAAAQRDTTSAVTMLSANQSEGLWLRDPEGWRWQWLVGGLTPRTNYTAYMLQTGKLAATSPLYFVTKSGTFVCLRAKQAVHAKQLTLINHVCTSNLRTPYSLVQLPLGAQPPILSFNIVRRPSPTSSRARHCTHSRHAPIRRRREHHLRPHQLHQDSHHASVRARLVQPACNVRGLPARVPYLALHGILPAVRRGVAIAGRAGYTGRAGRAGASTAGADERQGGYDTEESSLACVLQ